MSAFHCNKTEECHYLLSALTRVATHLLFSNGHRHLTNGACLFRPKNMKRGIELLGRDESDIVPLI